ncbi:hypothetical protein BDQ17DRAFT_1437676 [Cyathus striatus]|nr:hypothetical protein BDQ17DRAFT_1437676 [Cyathus striatus]
MPIRVIALFRRRPDITHEQFSEHWGTKHADIVASLNVVKRNIIRYTQFHILPQETSALADAGYSIAQYDGMAELIADNLDDFREMTTDEGYIKTSTPDADKFIDKTSVTFLVVESHVKHERAM